MTEEKLNTESTVCYRHLDKETGLRCIHCDRYICIKCANHTPVGYICPECLYQRQDKFFDGTTNDYIIAIAISLPLSCITVFIFAYIIGYIGWFSWLISFLLAPTVAAFIAEAVRRGVQRRRSRHLAKVVVACFVIPAIAVALFNLFILGTGFYGLITIGILLFFGVGTILMRLR
ncbi:MAG: hypothetical protein B6242_14500 [Anaerolineaceae bacterium 4572_78]|nr:MAG: hypothetical protein B6242_14500 [Anaerolineaceae bacterium 4572_78]